MNAGAGEGKEAAERILPLVDGRFHAAAGSMRCILIAHARAKAAVSLASLPDPTSPAQPAGFLIFDEAITRLGTLDEHVASVVQGYSPTVKRSWTFARGWLKEAIEPGLV